MEYKKNIEEVYKDFEFSKIKYKMIDLSYYIFNNIINIYSSQTHEVLMILLINIKMKLINKINIIS